MSLNSKILVALGLVAAVGLALWLGFSGGDTPVPQPESPLTVENDTPPVRTNTSPVFTDTRTRTRSTNATVASVSATDTNLMTDWEDRIDQILGDDTEVEEKGRKMLELLPHFPLAGQVETAQHISNLLADEDYEKFGNYLTDPKTPESLQDVILGDVLNRPNDLKLPLLLKTARNPENAKAGEAKDILELYLEDDYGDDWARWEREMEAWLRENPE